MSLFLKNKIILFNVPNSLFIKCELSRKIYDKTVRFSTVFFLFVCGFLLVVQAADMFCFFVKATLLEFVKFPHKQV